MSYGYLEKMLEMLTSAYTRRDLQNLRHNQPLETNIGKVFSLFATGLEIIRENAITSTTPKALSSTATARISVSNVGQPPTGSIASLSA
mgnify:CR=1 FL=1